jgi:hypothetical protein
VGAPASSDKARTPTAKCCGISEDPVAPAAVKTATPIPVKVETAAAPELSPREIRQVMWGSQFGLNYGYVAEGYSPGYPGYAFGPPRDYPLHGYRSPYYWAGHTYRMHCYCDEGYCPDYCPGYRGACYKPCWNDAGTLLFERRCGRGSPLDCLWHMGGYERPCRTICCPYVCDGAPSFHTYGFPHGTAGDPNYRQPRGTVPPTPPEKYADPYPPIPQSNPLPIELPEDPRVVPPKTRFPSPAPPVEPPTPMPPQ